MTIKFINSCVMTPKPENTFVIFIDGKKQHICFPIFDRVMNIVLFHCISIHRYHKLLSKDFPHYPRLKNGKTEIPFDYFRSNNQFHLLFGSLNYYYY
jgi:hypothetical protein